ncbi:hypothetical protein M9458_027140, partial [Cirrhinus mrigala]
SVKMVVGVCGPPGHHALSREFATVTPPSLNWEEKTVKAVGGRRKNVKPNPVQ